LHSKVRDSYIFHQLFVFNSLTCHLLARSSLGALRAHRSEGEYSHALPLRVFYFGYGQPCGKSKSPHCPDPLFLVARLLVAYTVGVDHWLHLRVHSCLSSSVVAVAVVPLHPTCPLFCEDEAPFVRSTKPIVTAMSSADILALSRRDTATPGAAVRSSLCCASSALALSAKRDYQILCQRPRFHRIVRPQAIHSIPAEKRQSATRVAVSPGSRR